jgi:hypothetical protein
MPVCPPPIQTNRNRVERLWARLKEWRTVAMEYGQAGRLSPCGLQRRCAPGTPGNNRHGRDAVRPVQSTKAVLQGTLSPARERFIDPTHTRAEQQRLLQGAAIGPWGQRRMHGGTVVCARMIQ